MSPLPAGQIVYGATPKREPLLGLDIRESLSDREGLALWELAGMVAMENAVFVEIGSWKGHSTMFLGKVAMECNGNVFCIDHWKGNSGIPEHEKTKNCFDIFRHNIEALGLNDCVHPLLMESEMASRIFADNVADLVFIDADHRYSYIKQDLEVWWTKVKVGGIICGHDCDVYYSTYPDRSLIDDLREYDGFSEVHLVGGEVVQVNGGKCMHPGIAKALFEFFGDTHTRIEGTTIWYKRKEAGDARS